MDWGKGILIVVISFVVTMLIFVFIAFRQENHMIEDNYYTRELKYQAVIDAKKNFLPYKDELKILDSGNYVYLILPEKIAENIDRGEVDVIKYDDPDYDRVFRFKFQTTAFPKDSLTSGLYKLKIHWASNNVPYYYELDRSFTK